jgi:hypothetical protein
VADTSTIQTLVNIFAAPREAFADIRQRPRFLVPMLLLILISSAVTALYLSKVDIGWMTEQSLRSIDFLDLTDAQIREMSDSAAERGPTSSIVSGVLSTMAGLVIILLLQALYLKIVSALSKDGVRYRQWFSLVCWTSLPTIFASIATAIFVLMNDVSFLPQTAINPISFGNLLGFDLSESAIAERVVMSLSPINIWTVVLLVLGYRALTSKSVTTAALVVLGPIVLIAGTIMALI